jgi:molybdate transport repressor ModE-like protein
MDLRQLSALVAIADHGSFSAAARSLYTVQSNVSGHVARLERELGVSLVDRQRGELTEEGAIVVERARRVLREMDEITADLASRGADVHGDSRVGLIGTTARWLLPQFLDSLATNHPGVHVTVHEGSTTILVSRLVAGHLDGAVVHLPIDDPELEVRALFSEDLVLVAPTGHELHRTGKLSLREMAKVPVLLPPRGTALRRVIDRAAAAAGTELVAQAEIDGVRLLASLAFEGHGAAIVPSTAVPKWLEGAFSRVSVPELPRRSIGWAQRRRPAPGAPTRAVVDILNQVIAKRGPRMPGVHLD